MKQMRCILYVILFILTAGPCFAGTVRFSDSRVESAVRKALRSGYGSGITEAALRQLTSLELDSVRSLKGLEQAANLRVLKLSSVADTAVYEDLKALIALRSLKISGGTPVADFSFLESLTGLEEIDIYHRSDTKNVPLDFVHLRRCGRLRALTLQGYVPANIGRWAASLPRLEKLHLNERHPLPDLEFLRSFPQLKSLVLMGLRSSDLSPLADLHNMENLWINCKGRAGNTEFLRGMTRLKTLGIYYIEDSRGLRYLRQNPNLRKLDLVYMELRDLNFLRGLTELRQLSVNDNAISDISGLAGCRRLRSLHLSRNSVTDISPLAGLPDLVSVDVDFNNIKNFYPLYQALDRRSRNIFFQVGQNGADFRPGSRNLRLIKALFSKCRYPSRQEKEYKAGNFWKRGQLFADEGLEKAVRRKLGIPTGPIPADRYASIKKLRYGGDEFSRLEGIERLTGLEDLDVGVNIVDVTPLKRLFRLRKLSLWRNRMTHIRVLKGLVNLEKLNLTGTAIVSLEGVEGMTKLRDLHMQGSRVADLSPLRGLTRLEWLTLGNMPASDLSPLAGLVHLRTLKVPGMGVKSLAPLSGLGSLVTLEAPLNRITDLSPLRTVTRLHGLDISGNPVASLEPLMGLRPSWLGLDVSYTKVPMRDIWRVVRTVNRADTTLDLTGNGYRFVKGHPDYGYLQKILKRVQARRIKYRDGNTVGGDEDSGKRAYDFTLTNHDGRRVSLSDFRGKVVLLEFGADWCGFCHKQAAYMGEVKRKLRALGVNNFVSVVILDRDKSGPSISPATLSRWARKYNLPYVLGDPGSRVGKRMGASAKPHNIIVLPNGNIAAGWRGAPSTAEALIRRLKNYVPSLFGSAPPPGE